MKKSTVVSFISKSNNLCQREIQKRWLNTKELSTYLGLSRGTIYNLKYKGLLPYSKTRGIGIRFDKLKIDSLLEREEIPTIRDRIEQ